MRGIAFTLICSIFLNSGLVYQPDELILSNSGEVAFYEESKLNLVTEDLETELLIEEDTQEESGKENPPKEEFTKEEVTEKESTEEESGKENPPKEESTKKEPTKEEPTEEKSTEEESTKKEPTEEKSTEEESTKKESTKENPTKEETSQEESTKDENTEDESLEEEELKDATSENEEEKDSLEEDSVSDNTLLEEDTVSQNELDLDIAKEDMDLKTDSGTEDFDINDYALFGSSKAGISVYVKKGMTDGPLKSHTKSDFDWEALEEEIDVTDYVQSMQMQSRTRNATKRISVSSESDMLKLANLWNEGETFQGVEIIQTGNITFTQRFPGIGFIDDKDDVEKSGFQGTFDGNGFVFYGLKHVSNRGIFPCIGKYGTVKNITLMADKLTLKSNEVECFNPLTEINLGTIDNYYMDANVTAEEKIGIWPCAWVNLGTIKDSVVKGSVEAKVNNIGIFAMYNVAGGKILNCHNYASIETPKGHVGGIALLCQGVVIQVDDIKQNHVLTPIDGGSYYAREIFPDISSEEVKSYYDSDLKGNLYYMMPLIKDCYNYGNISGVGYVGGICSQTSYLGYWFEVKDDSGNLSSYSKEKFSDGMIVNCINYGNINGTYSLGGIVAQSGERILQCANYGTIKGNEHLAGIVGTCAGSYESLNPYVPGDSIEKCANFGNIIGNWYVGGICDGLRCKFYDNYNRGNITVNTSIASDKLTYMGGLAGGVWNSISHKWGRCYSTGSVDKKTANCKGLIGYQEVTLPSNFYLTGDMQNVESEAGYVTKQWLKSDQALNALGSAFKKDTYNINDGYPILAWQTAKANKMRVHFLTQGGSRIATTYVYGGDKVTAPEPPEKEGAVFEGWYTDLSYTTKWDFSKSVNAPLCLYAKWKNLCKVTYSLAGGYFEQPNDFLEEIYVMEGTLLEDVGIPFKEGYAFSGWGINGSSTKFWNTETDCVTKDVELKAIWKSKSKVTVTYYHGGADDQRKDSEAVQMDYSAKIQLNSYTKKNHKFLGWYTEPDGKGEAYTDGIRVYNNLKLYAHWLNIERYTVVFDSMGGNEIAAIGQIVPGNCITMPKPIKENALFRGWYTKPDGEGICYTKDSPITGNLTLYACWQEDIISDGYHIKAIDKQMYTGSKIMPEVKVYREGKLLTKEEDYTLSYANCVSVGTAKVYIYIKNTNKKYVMNYQIIEKDLSEQDITYKVYNAYRYGKAEKLNAPVVEVSYGTYMLKKDVDYAMTIEDNGGNTATAVFHGKGDFKGNKKITFAIKIDNISNATVKKLDKYTYTGEEIKPVAELTTKEGIVLREGIDYVCEYANNIKPGTAQMEIHGVNDCAGSKRISFTISKKSVAEEDVTIAVQSPETYDGKAKQPKVTVTYGDRTLEQGTDYSLKYSNHVNVSEAAVVTVTGKGNYFGQKTAYFNIEPRDIEDTMIKVEDVLYYEGKDPIPKETVTDGTKTLQKNKDYKIEYFNDTDNGCGHMIIQGIGNYTGTSSEKNYRIVKDLITNAKVSKIAPLTYTGEELNPQEQIEVFYKNQPLEEGKDYIVECPENENTNAGKGSIYIVGQGVYGGRKKVTYTINKKAIDFKNPEFSLASVESKTYTGEKVTPKINLAYHGTTLVEGVDYKLSYQNNINVGKKAKIIIQGMGNFKGTWKTDFSIEPTAITVATIEAQDTMYRKNKNCTPKVVVKYGKKTLKAKKDYLVIYDSNNQCQDGTVSVRGLGNFAALGEDTIEVSYHVYEVSIGKVKCEKIPTQMMVGDEVSEPKLRLSYGGKVLVEDVDYALQFTDNTRPGKAKVEIRGLGRFGGSRTLSFQIKKK